MSAAVEVPVAVVGAGPVGQLLAALLGERGHEVLVLDRRPAPYPLPRAVAFDDEIARVLAAAQVLQRLPVQVADTYEWRNGAGQVLLRFDWSAPGASGHPTSNMFAQPELEAALAERLATLASVRVQRDRRVVDLAADPNGVSLRAVDAAGGAHTIRARYVVGADGADSVVRDHMRTAVTDLGFAHDWLIADVLLHEPRRFDPVNVQFCDPTRPTTQVSGGPGRRRWEFMRLPGESVAGLGSPERAWQLLAPFDVHPGNAVLERRAVYTFRARWVDDWRDGPLLLAGDAAHLMPPFAGQGLCSGFRDAANLAWKLDLVLSGRSGDALLDTYSTERSAHVRHAVHLSVELGRVICQLDPAAAAARDAALLAAGADPARALPPAPPPVLGPGAVGAGPGAGQVAPQPRVRVAADRLGLLDDALGRGFVVAAAVDPRAVLDPARLAVLDGLGAHLVAVTPELDVDGTWRQEWARLGCAAEVLRPDGYRFGAAAHPAGLPALVDELAARLHLSTVMA